MYPAIVDPLSAGATQEITTSVPTIAVVGELGVLGIAGITAPLPGKDYIELPLAFAAVTFASILIPADRRIG